MLMGQIEYFEDDLHLVLLKISRFFMGFYYVNFIKRDLQLEFFSYLDKTKHKHKISVEIFE